MATTTWQMLSLKAGQAGAEWQILRLATTGSVTFAPWQILRLSAGSTTASTLVPNKVTEYDAGETITITALRSGSPPAGRVWRLAATTGITTTPFPISSAGDVATIRAPISGTDGSLTIGYKPSDAPEIFLTVNVHRALDWVWWNGARRPAVWRVITGTGPLNFWDDGHLGASMVSLDDHTASADDGMI